MNIKKILGLMVCLPLISAGNLFAGEPNTLELTDTSGVVGGTVDVKVYWTDGGTTSGTVQFRIAHNPAEFSFSSCTAFENGWTFFACTDGGPAGTVDVAAADLPGGPVTGAGGDGPQHLFTVTFNVLAGPGSYTMMSDPTFPDGDPDPDTVVTDDGEATTELSSTIDILGPAYDSIGYAPGAPIAFGSHTAGDVDPAEVFDIDNIGEMGTSLDGSCGITGPDAGAYTLDSGATFNVAEAGPNQTVQVACDSSGLAPGVYNNATLSCSHNGGPPGAASPVDYALSCTILAAPAPNYASVPTPGSPFDFGQSLTTDPDQDLGITISNDGNLDGLDGACSISNSAGGVFSIDSGANYGPLAQGAMASRTVTCSTATAGDFVGELSCTALAPAANAGTFTYPLNCGVDSIPTYGSTPAPGGNLPMSGPAGNGAPTTNLVVDNAAGEPGSLLSGSCTLDVAGDPEISLPSGGAFSNIAQGASANVALECDDTTTGNFFNTLTCNANAPASDTGPFVYNVSCTIGQPDPATYVSTPYAGGNPGDLIDLNEGNDPPPVNNGVAVSTVLTISNGADPGDDFLDLQGCTYSGDTQITANPVTLTTQLDPGQSTDVTFTCDTDDIAGTFMGTYTCPFDENPTPPPPPPVEGGSGITSPATYPVECEVREQFSDVTESPASGTPQTAELMPGEEATFSFTFTENIDELLDGSVDCSLASGTDFAITAGGPFPATVPSGGSTQVDVTFTDPGAGDTFNDTLNCTITDNPDGGADETEDVSWPLEVTVIGRNVTFRVTKDFDDDNPMGVEVFLDCNTGLPLQQNGVVHDPDAVGLTPGQFTELQFVVVDFEPGTMDCDIEETVPLGYVGSYFAAAGNDGVAGDVFDDEEGCHYEGLESADFVCEIDNELQEVDLVVNKEWIDDNPGFNLPLWVEIEVSCQNVQVIDEAEGIICTFDGYGGGNVCFSQHIDPSSPGVFGILPHWDGSTTCSVTEMLEPGVEADTSDCDSVSLTPGNGGECTIVNTRLYEGIPTLSQYGLLLMALMMLGVGLVGFRRYS